MAKLGTAPEMLVSQSFVTFLTKTLSNAIGSSDSESLPINFSVKMVWPETKDDRTKNNTNGKKIFKLRWFNGCSLRFFQIRIVPIRNV